MVVSRLVQVPTLLSCLAAPLRVETNIAASADSDKQLPPPARGSFQHVWHSLKQRLKFLSERFGVVIHPSPADRPNQLHLPMSRDGAVAGEGGQHLIVAEVLGPGPPAGRLTVVYGLGKQLLADRTRRRYTGLPLICLCNRDCKSGGVGGTWISVNQAMVWASPLPGAKGGRSGRGTE